MNSIQRMSPDEVQSKLNAQSGLMLVCAYSSDDKFHTFHLEGAISLNELKAMETNLPKDREIVFYCN